MSELFVSLDGLRCLNSFVSLYGLSCVMHLYFCVRRTNFEDSKLYVIVTNRKLNQKNENAMDEDKIMHTRGHKAYN
jgi:hypothetical protein